MRIPAAALAALVALCLVRPAHANTYTVVIDPSAGFNQAQSAAAQAGGYLVTITSAAEQAAVEAAILAASPPGNGAFWINLLESTECTYAWGTGESTCYGNFYYAEPNNGLGGTVESRGSLIWSSDLARRGRWNDAPLNGLTGLGDVSRLGYVIEFGPLDPAPTCGASVPAHPASACTTPPGGAVVLYTRVSGVAVTPGAIGRTIIDISDPPAGPSGRVRARALATYNVSLPVPNGSTAGFIGSVLRDSINAQIGGSGFVANHVSSSDPALVRMWRVGSNYSSSDNSTASGITLQSSSGGPPPPGPPAGVAGPGLSGIGVAALALLLLLLGGRTLRARARAAP